VWVSVWVELDFPKIFIVRMADTASANHTEQEPTSWSFFRLLTREKLKSASPTFIGP
jgi:hypothetical protein